MTDLRSDRMPSAEGYGLARKAWDKYANAVNKATAPIVEPLVKNYGVSVISDNVGFWLLWHMYGGFDGLVELGMPRTTIFRRVKNFRRVFQAHPDEFRFDGVTVETGNLGAHKVSADTP